MSTMAEAPQPLEIDHAGVLCLIRRRLELTRKHSRESQDRFQRGEPFRKQQEHAETLKLRAQVQQSERQANAKKKAAKKSGSGEAGHGDRTRTCSTGDTTTFGESVMNTTQPYDAKAKLDRSSPVDLVFKFDEPAMKKTLASRGYSPHSIASMGHPSSAPAQLAASQYAQVRGYDQAPGFAQMHVEQQPPAQVMQHGAGQPSFGELKASEPGGQLIGGPSTMSGALHNVQVPTPSLQSRGPAPHPAAQVSGWEPGALGGGSVSRNAPMTQHLSHIGMEESDHTRHQQSPTACYGMQPGQARTLPGGHHDGIQATGSYMHNTSGTQTWPRMNGHEVGAQSRPLDQELSDFDDVLWQMQNSESGWPGQTGQQDYQPSSPGINQRKSAYYNQRQPPSSRLCHMPADVSPTVQIPAQKSMQYAPQHDQSASLQPMYQGYHSNNIQQQHPMVTSHGNQPAIAHHSNSSVSPYSALPGATDPTAQQTSSYNQQWVQNTQHSPSAAGSRMHAPHHNAAMMQTGRPEQPMSAMQHSAHIMSTGQMPQGAMHAAPPSTLSMSQPSMTSSAFYPGHPQPPQQHTMTRSFSHPEPASIQAGNPYAIGGSHMGTMPMDVSLNEFMQPSAQGDFMM